MLRWIAIVCYAAMILVVASIPGTTEPLKSPSLIQGIPPLVQNLLHAPLYFGLAACLLWGLETVTTCRKTQFALTLVVTFCFSVIDETFQYFIPGRTSSCLDLLIDLTGASLAIYFYHRFIDKATQEQ